MEAAFRVIIYVAVGLLLIALNIWYLGRVKEALTGSDMPLVIAPFQIVGKSDDNGKFGTVLAYMLRARLGKIREEMASSYRSLEEAKSLKLIRPLSNPIVPVQKPDLAYLENEPPLPNEVFQPLNLNMSVSGVEVGGVVSWLHRWLTEEKSLIVSVSYHGDRAIASGNISTSGKGILWVESVGTDDDEMIADVAYAITQKRFAERYQEVEALTPKEFRVLLTGLHKAAELNHQAALGRASDRPYQELLTQLEELIKQVPKWRLLVRLTAEIAERAERSETALLYYQAELSLISDTLPSPDGSFLETKIKELNQQIEEKNKAAVALAPHASEDNVRETVIGKIRSIAGVSSIDMDGTTTIAIVGPVPPKDTLPQNQFSVITLETGADTKSDSESAEYMNTVVQSVRLVAPKTKFMFVAMNLETDLSAFRSKIVAALNRLLSLPNKPNVLLLPYSGLTGAEIAPLFEQLSSAGVAIVISSGNDPSKPIPFANTPLLNNLMVVSAVNLDGHKASFAPSDQQVFWAPGDRIPLLLNGKVIFRSGTSYSAGIAAGVCARVLERRKDLTPTNLVQLLRTSAQKTIEDGPAVINLNSAISKVGN